MKNTEIGIWLDKKQAFIIRSLDGNTNVQKVLSNLETYPKEAGAPAKKPFGASEVVLEKKGLERKKHQLNHYFDEIIAQLKPADQVYIFGPADTKSGLQESIRNNKKFTTTIFKTETADSMTEAQMIAQTRKAFQTNPKR